MDQDDLNALKASELKMMCKERGLRVSGTKSELIGRLMENQHQKVLMFLSHLVVLKL